MFLIYFLPKIFSFFLVPIYTFYLTTDEYGISDLIISSAGLLGPFVALATPTAVMRYTIENKSDIRPYNVSMLVLIKGLLLLAVSLFVVQVVFGIYAPYLFFLFLIVGASLLADIHLSYARGIEDMKTVTLCGVGSAFTSIVANILFIVVLQWGLYGFLLASIVGYLFSVSTVQYRARERHLFSGLSLRPDKKLQKEMLQFSIPLIFSGLSWWVVSSSDRYFVTLLCGTAANGVYAVAYKIPVILQALDNVFYQAWIFTLYDSYKSEDGKKYIAKVFNFYAFIFCAGCSLLIVLDLFISGLLFSNDFFEAWRYVPPLLLSIVFNSSGGLMGAFFSVYKKTKLAMNISIIAALTNIVLNWILIIVYEDAMGAAIATAVTFFVSWCLNIYYAISMSNVKIRWGNQLLMYGILAGQSVVMINTADSYYTMVGLLIILFMNHKTIIWAIEKRKSIFRRR